MTAVIQGDALHIPLADETVDLIVTSPPYFALRSYRDDGIHYAGQLGSEATPQAFLEALWAVTKECWRVLKPSGSMFVNLGDKRSGSGGHNNAGISAKSTLQGNGHVGGGPKIKATLRNAPDRYQQAAFGRPKSKMLLPHRYAEGCEDGLADPCVKDHGHVGRHPAYIESEMCRGVGWIVRQDLVWEKANGLPESVTDRTRDSHEFWFHMTKQGDYYAAVDEVREAQKYPDHAQIGKDNHLSTKRRGAGDQTYTFAATSGTRTINPLGKLPGSVWKIASEPLAVPDYMVDTADGWRLWDAPAVWQHTRYRFEAGDLRPILVRDIDHFAAFPQELPRRLILGWSPSAICSACGQGRRPVVAKELVGVWHDKAPQNTRYEGQEGAHKNGRRSVADPMMSTFGSTEATITGYACACTPYTDHPGSGGGIPTNDSMIAANERRVSPTSALRMRGGGPAWNKWKAEHPTPGRQYHFDGWTPPPTRPAVVLDPFGGTGTVAMVARALGRTGISLDLSADYTRLARWRIFQSGHAAKTRERTNRAAQGTLPL